MESVSLMQIKPQKRIINFVNEVEWFSKEDREI